MLGDVIAYANYKPGHHLSALHLLPREGRQDPAYHSVSRIDVDWKSIKLWNKQTFVTLIPHRVITCPPHLGRRRSPLPASTAASRPLAPKRSAHATKGNVSRPTRHTGNRAASSPKTSMRGSGPSVKT